MGRGRLRRLQRQGRAGAAKAAPHVQAAGEKVKQAGDRILKLVE